MSRQTIHSAALRLTGLTLVTALTLATAALALPSLLPMRSFASLPPTRASAPDFAAPQDRASQTGATETDAMHPSDSCVPLADAGTESQSPLSNATSPSNATSLSNANPARVIPPRQNLPGLRSFGQITPTLFRGGRPNEEGLACLAKMGVSMVISTEGRYKDLHKRVERLGMQYVSMGWECSFPEDKTFAKFLQLLRDNPGKKVFVYCHYGDDRTGMMIAAYRMAEQGWSAGEAKEEMKAFGFNFAHRRICTGLSDYEEHFPQHWREGRAFEKLRSTTPPQP